MKIHYPTSSRPDYENTIIVLMDKDGIIKPEDYCRTFNDENILKAKRYSTFLKEGNSLVVVNMDECWTPFEE